ncbi:6-phosphofructo-2-kinase/fructose-2,6-bisphosphatase-like isoform X2 [Symsagittifera roscoffensis]|uniref:6-phosphofructo-2-kinase/fructose-2, 6-bisphosphatase-like isoform X2 n=1 Tax=Symsagittifera roscoffensis TaxID=84072 RepID=UPI00307C67FA
MCSTLDDTCVSVAKLDLSNSINSDSNQSDDNQREKRPHSERIASSSSGSFLGDSLGDELHPNVRRRQSSGHKSAGFGSSNNSCNSPMKIPHRRAREHLLSCSSVDDLDDYLTASSAPNAYTIGHYSFVDHHRFTSSFDDSSIAYLVPEHNMRRSLYEMCQKHTVVVMVGLPARGKTFVSKKLVRYLNWIGIRSRVFNVGEYRRKRQMGGYGGYQGDEFFKSSNKAAIELRNQCALEALHDMDAWCQQKPGSVAVFDATNSTPDRRKLITNFCERLELDVMFVELITNDQVMLDANIREVKIMSPDYKHFANPDEAVADFKRRIEHYEETYVPLEENLHENSSYLKLIDCGKTYVVNRINSHVQCKIAYYLMNIHPTTRSFYFTRHGESCLNLQGRIGGNSDLSERGRMYAEKLGQYMNSLNLPDLQVWTSQLKRTIQTAQFVNAPKLAWKNLNEIDAGTCDSLTYEEIEAKYPKEFHARDENKYHYRYPRGESYEDLVARLESVIMELERSKNILVVCHQGVLRCLLAYYLEKELKDLPYLRCPLHTVFKLTPIAYGCRVEMIKLDVPAVDTHRGKPNMTSASPGIPESLEKRHSQSSSGPENSSECCS